MLNGLFRKLTDYVTMTVPQAGLAPWFTCELRGSSAKPVVAVITAETD